MAKPSDFCQIYDGLDAFKVKYELHKKVIGSGSYGKVQRAKLRATNQVRAVKIIDKLTMDENEVVRSKYEIDVLKTLSHPNIVQLYEVYESKSYIYMVIELVDGVQLFDAIVKEGIFSEMKSARVIK